MSLLFQKRHEWLISSTHVYVQTAPQYPRIIYYWSDGGVGAGEYSILLYFSPSPFHPKKNEKFKHYSGSWWKGSLRNVRDTICEIFIELSFPIRDIFSSFICSNFYAPQKMRQALLLTDYCHGSLGERFLTIISSYRDLENANNEFGIVNSSGAGHVFLHSTWKIGILSKATDGRFRSGDLCSSYL